ncbi:sensor histidine kinase [Pseudofulvibacter geojedonensis]|uniref:histidine kinase n=1 Tax=Pseudofulvibacter geojedonensis TaxID=1123758 RepID=A0ABW3HZY7_9FLAO
MNLFSEKYRVANRFISVAILASALGIMVHILLVIFFFAVKINEMGFYNVVSTFFFIIMYCMLKKRKNPQLVYFLISVEVILHSFLATHYIGYDCNFGYFILVLLPVFLLNIKWKKWQVYTYLLIASVAFYMLYYLFKDKTPIYLLNSELIKTVSLAIKMITLFIILAGIYYFSLIVNENDKELRRVNKVLVKRNEEKTMMMNETHHRVKNNLQMVNTLLRLQASKINDKHIVSMFKETRSRVMTIAALHEKMYQIDSIQSINAKEYITRLTNDIVENFTVDKKIETDIEIEEIEIPTQIMIPLSLVINEIITNSLKYAFNEKKEGTISVRLVSDDNNNRCELLIGDNGSGFSYANQKEGMGTKLISVFIEQLKGSISKEVSSGTTFKILFSRGLV